MKVLRALAVLRAEGTTPLGELLQAENRQFSRQDTIIVITPSVDEEWVAALEGELMRGIHSASVVLEPATFCGEGNPLVIYGALTSIGMPTYVVKRDDRIDAALTVPYNASSVRNLR